MHARKPYLLLLIFTVLAAAGQSPDLPERESITLPPDVLRGAFDLLNEGNPAFGVLEMEADARQEWYARAKMDRDQIAEADVLMADYGTVRGAFVDTLAQSLLREYAEKQRQDGDLENLEAIYAERDYLRASLAEGRTAFFEELLALLDEDQRLLVMPPVDDKDEPSYQPGDAASTDKMANWCTAHIMVIGSDSRYERDTCTKYTAPWNNVGRLNIGCSATLIGDRFVLTAAHCLIDGNGNFKNQSVIYFKLGQYNSNTTNYQTPFGTYYVKRAIVPSEYAETNNEEDRSFEYALLELNEPIPGATPMAFDYLSWATVSAKSAYTVGYPGQSTGRFVNNPVVGGSGSALQDSAYRWLNGGDSGLLVHSLDVEGGQSGSAIYVFNNGVRTLVGVMVGSPVSECEAGRVWGSRITTGAENRIRGWMANYWDNTWSAKRKYYTVLDPYSPNAPGCYVIGTTIEQGKQHEEAASMGFK